MAGVLAPRRPWRDRRVVLGVAGGIAAYKSVQLARDLTRLGAEVDVVLTRGGRRFATPLSFEALTGRPVLTDLFSARGAAMHIRLGAEADVVCVAPATADFIARAAVGRADDLLATTLLATRAPVVICPAMNDRMYAHPATERNLARLRERPGYAVAGPATGPLAFGEGEGPGRMLEPSEIVEHVGRALETDAFLPGRRVLITTGPTWEPVDPVRFVGNRSSGRMGHALARAAWRRGARVTLVSGPTHSPRPPGVRRTLVGTAREMLDAVTDAIPRADVVIFAAAVADYRPARARSAKLKRAHQGGSLSLELTANPDVARDTIPLRKPGAKVVGFALETEDLVARARAKGRRKAFDLVVANHARGPEGDPFGERNAVTLVAPDGAAEELPPTHKDEIAEAVLDRLDGSAPPCPRASPAAARG